MLNHNLAGAVVYFFFFSEFEFYGKQYKPSREVSPLSERILRPCKGCR